ncbi:MAG TPA: UPF0149 family protein [Hyphomicrobiaceae bacterium]|nr:UPF0149 family protein [Hyphomicrobiaceae bacterium]
MAMPASAAMQSPLLDLRGRSFALLDRVERDRLAAVLRPLSWIDGLITAVIIAPEEAQDWMEYIWREDDVLAAAAVEIPTAVDDHLIHVADTLCIGPEAYRPFLGDAGDQLAAAAQWASGFRFGIRLKPEPWTPLIEDEDTRSLLAAIFALERDEDLPAQERDGFPFRDMPAERREHLRRSTLSILPDIVLALHDYASGEADEAQDSAA